MLRRILNFIEVFWNSQFWQWGIRGNIPLARQRTSEEVTGKKSPQTIHYHWQQWPTYAASVNIWIDLSPTIDDNNTFLICPSFPTPLTRVKTLGQPTRRFQYWRTIQKFSFQSVRYFPYNNSFTPKKGWSPQAILQSIVEGWSPSLSCSRENTQNQATFNILSHQPIDSPAPTNITNGVTPPL